jgi:hypothetical protein
MRILIIVMTMAISINSFADCRQTIKEDYRGIEKDLKSRTLQYAYIGPVIGVPLVFISAPVGIGFISMLGGDYVTRKLTIKERQKLITAVDEAYAYIESNKAGKILAKIHKKVNRRSNKNVELSEIANAIIDSNENGDLCHQGKSNIRSQAKRIALELSEL